MAYLDDKMKQGYILSNEALKKPNFDTEAFIVASLLRLMGYKEDLIPESQIDEMTDTSKDLFVKYMHSRTDTDLKSYLMQIYQIITELFYSVNKEQKGIILEYIAKFEKIS